MGKPSKIHDKHKPYGTRKTFYTQLIYIAGALLWASLILTLGLYPADTLGWVFILLPIVVFYIGFANADGFTIEVEEDMFKVSHLSLGLIITLSLFVWITNDYGGDQKHIVTILTFAIAFSLMSVIDIWVIKKWVALVKHIKSIFQTISISLLLYVLYLYYLNKRNPNFR